MIVHIPHDGQWIPSGFGRFDGTVTPLRDFGARQVFEGGYGTCLVFPVDRLVCDVERFVDGEPMESIGMGICYERNADMGHLRTVDAEMRERVIRCFYEPHHMRLRTLVDGELSEYGKCLIIDGHTFSAVKRAYESSDARPQIDIGHDGDAPSVKVADLLTRVLGRWYDVSVNEPFAGSLRPLERIGDEHVASVMIEVRQDLDMELARERVQWSMGLAFIQFYGRSPLAVPKRRVGTAAFTDRERHRRIDALADKYAYVEGFSDMAYARWDDESLGSDALTEIERQVMSLDSSLMG